jgi:hypothetical protein
MLLHDKDNTIFGKDVNPDIQKDNGNYDDKKHVKLFDMYNKNH